MRMRPVLSIVMWAALAASAGAIPFIPPPMPVYEAPIDRALANVAADTNLEPAQRERILGRLNLLAYARNDGAFAYLRDGDNLNEGGATPCSEVPRPTRGMQPGQKPAEAPEGLCARLDFNLGPDDELPGNIVAQPSLAARARLEVSERHYAQAIALDGENLRARLGHAYTLDRLGRSAEARRELLAIIRLGMPQVAGPQSNWETHAVLTETTEHLAHLARTRADRRKVAELRARLQASRPVMYVTPIVVPLADRDFSSLVDPASPVAFDFAGTGDRRAQGWLTTDAAWLVWDPQKRGEVRSGFDMIGARTWAVFWNDGFEALRSLDDNADGELTGNELGGLALWRDADGDGVSDAGEVAPLSAHGIVALAARGEATRRDLITAPNGVRFANGAALPLYDWTPGLGADRTRVAENARDQLAFSGPHP